MFEPDARQGDFVSHSALDSQWTYDTNGIYTAYLLLVTVQFPVHSVHMLDIL